MCFEVRDRVTEPLGEIELRGDDIGGLAVHVAARVAALLAPTPEPLESYAVGTRVNAVANDDPSCREPVSAG